MKYILITLLVLVALFIFFMDNNHPVVRSVMEHPTADANISYEAGVELAKGCAAELRRLESNLTDAASREQYATRAVEIKKNCRKQINRLYNEGDSQPGMPLVIPTVAKVATTPPPISIMANGATAAGSWQQTGPNTWNIRVTSGEILTTDIEMPANTMVRISNQVGQVRIQGRPDLEFPAGGRVIVPTGQAFTNYDERCEPDLKPNFRQPRARCFSLLVQIGSGSAYNAGTAPLTLPTGTGGRLVFMMNTRQDEPHDVISGSFQQATIQLNP